jgi:hypothetical protein
MANTMERQRARVRRDLPSKKIAVIDLGGRRLSGPLCQLSIDGGSLRWAKIFGESTFAQITLPTATGSVVGTIQFLKSGAPDIQAFRFVQLDSRTRSRLETALSEMDAKGAEENSHSMRHFCKSATRRVTRKGQTKRARS